MWSTAPRLTTTTAPWATTGSRHHCVCSRTTCHDQASPPPVTGGPQTHRRPCFHSAGGCRCGAHPWRRWSTPTVRCRTGDPKRIGEGLQQLDGSLGRGREGGRSGCEGHEALSRTSQEVVAVRAQCRQRRLNNCRGGADACPQTGGGNPELPAWDGFATSGSRSRVRGARLLCAGT
jgi:hypothetical protein